LRAGRLQLHEHLEDPFQVRRGDADTVIFHRDEDGRSAQSIPTITSPGRMVGLRLSKEC
jgi:hypothetical protein